MQTALKSIFEDWKIDIRQKVGLIFDIDELLYDNSQEIFEAYKMILAARNIELQQTETFPGKDLFEILDKMKQKYHLKETVEDLVAERRIHYLEILQNSKTNNKKGVNEFLNLLDKNRKYLNVSLAYASSSEKAFVDIILSKIFINSGLSKYTNQPETFFSFSKLNESVSTCWQPELKKKPSPMVYLKTLDKMEISPKQCIAFEDSKSGMEAALAAGLNVIIIPSKFFVKYFEEVDQRFWHENNICKMDSFLDFLPLMSLLVQSS